MGTGKAKLGNFFEDFAVGQVLQHATPRTIGPGDVALYMGLYGPCRARRRRADRARRGVLQHLADREILEEIANCCSLVRQRRGAE